MSRVVTDEMFSEAQKEFNSAPGWNRDQPTKMRAALEVALAAPPSQDDAVAVVERLRDSALIEADNETYGWLLRGQKRRIAQAADLILAALRASKPDGGTGR